MHGGAGTLEDTHAVQTLYDATVEFEKSTKDVQLPRTRVLNKANLVQWLEKVRLHVPELPSRSTKTLQPRRLKPRRRLRRFLGEAELAAKAIEALKPQNTLDPGVPRRPGRRLRLVSFRHSSKK